jgi:hypothetical protein
MLTGELLLVDLLLLLQFNHLVNLAQNFWRHLGLALKLLVLAQTVRTLSQ